MLCTNFELQFQAHFPSPSIPYLLLAILEVCDLCIRTRTVCTWSARSIQAGAALARRERVAQWWTSNALQFVRTRSRELRVRRAYSCGRHNLAERGSLHVALQLVPFLHPLPTLPNQTLPLLLKTRPSNR